MKLEEFKKEVYDLAKFNASLTKGYGRVWKSADYDGYTYKNKKLKKLVDVAEYMKLKKERLVEIEKRKKTFKRNRSET